MSDLFWDLVQQQKIAGATLKAESAQRSASSLHRDVEALEERIERLSLGMQALWELCRSQLNLSDGDLLDRIRDVDLRDGKLDGRMGRVTVECRSCQRPNTSTRLRCLYCAEPLPQRP